MENKLFKVAKEIENNGERIPVGTEISIVNNIIYVNGFQLMPGLYNMFYKLIKDELKSPNYLIEHVIPYNKC